MNDGRPQPIKFTTEEGGKWHEWGTQRPLPPPGNLMHSIMFDDGTVFDALNGWRHGHVCTQCGSPWVRS